MADYRMIKRLSKEKKFFIPEEHIVHQVISNTPEWVMEYFIEREIQEFFQEIEENTIKE